MKVREKAKIRNRYNQVPHLTKDTIWERDKSTRKCHPLEGQEVSPFPTGDHNATINIHHRRQTHTLKKKIHIRSTALERQASRCQQAFSKHFLVNLISKDTHLVFSMKYLQYSTRQNEINNGIMTYMTKHSKCGSMFV